MDNSKYHIPACLDEPVKFMGLSVSELGFLFAGFILGLLFDQFVLFCFIGCMATIFLRYWGENGSDVSIQSLMYWHLPSWITSSESLPRSSLRKYLG